MNKKLSRKLYGLGFVVLQFGFANAFLSPTFAKQATSTGTSTHQAQQPTLVFNQSRAPGHFERAGRPSRRTSGGSRGECSDQLIALLPGNDQIATSETTSDVACRSASIAEQAVTLEPLPTLWFYVPAQVQPGVNSELVLLDENAQALSIETIELPADSGIMGIQLSQPLAVGQTYQWVFSILQQPNAPSENPTVEGYVQRVSPEPALTDTLNAADSPWVLAQVLAEQGIWHDALDVIAQMRRTAPNDAIAQASWESLLSTVGLGAIAQADFVN